MTESPAKHGADNDAAAGPTVSDADPPVEHRSESGHPRSRPGRLAGQLPIQELTDVGNAARFFFAFRGRVHRVHDEGRFILWNGKVWERDPADGQTRWLFCNELGRQLDQERVELQLRAGEAEKGQRDEDPKMLLRLAGHVARWRDYSHSRTGVRAALDLLASFPEVTISTTALDRRGDTLVLANGTLDLKSRRLGPHVPEDLTTKMLPFEYDPTAAAPAFLCFLEQVVPDARTREFLQRVAGRSLIWFNERRPIVVLWGSGRNGKSTFISAIRGNVATYAVEADSATLLERTGDRIENDLARMTAARLVLVRELPESRRLDESLVKQLTGGDRIPARFLHHEFFDFEPGFVILLASNAHPTIADSTAMRDRIFVVPFTITIPEGQQDPALAKRLAEQQSGILNWAIEGLAHWRFDGFAPPPAVREFTAAVAAEDLNISRFVTECLEPLPPGAERYLASGRVYEAYRMWAVLHGAKPWTDAWLGRKLGEQGLVPSRFGKARDRGYRDLALNGEWAEKVYSSIAKGSVLKPDKTEFMALGGSTAVRTPVPGEGGAREFT